MLNRLVLAVAFALVAVRLGWAESDAVPQQLLDGMLAQHDFIRNAKTPFILDADFVGQANIALKGHLRLQWDSKDRWWVRVDFDSFQQIVMRDGENEHTMRNASFTPVPVHELLDVLNLEQVAGADRAHKVKNKVEAGVELECMQGHRETLGENHEFCFDPSTHDLLSESWKGDLFQFRRESFSDYVETEGMRYPRKLSMRMDAAEVFSAQITDVKPAPFDATLLQPPPGSIERRKCADLRAPIPTKKTTLAFVKWPRTILWNMLTMTVLPDGSVSDVDVILSGGSVFDKRSVEVLSQWKFKPAMCGKQPVADDVTVEIDYQPLPRSRNRSALVGASTIKIR